MRKRASAARSRTSAWAAARARARWPCTPTASRMSKQTCASAAAPARRSARTTARRLKKQKMPDRPEQLRRLRPLHRGLSQGRHPSDFPSQRQAPQLQDRRIRQGRSGRAPQLLHQHCPRHLAELRLPPGKRRPHCPGRRHVRIRRPLSRWIWPAPRLSTVSRFFQTAPSPI